MEGPDDQRVSKPIISKWIYDVHQKRPKNSYELTYGRHKVFLFESLYRCITRHNIQECFQLLKLLPSETTLDPYILMRFVFLLLECNETEAVNKNVIIYMELLFSKMDLCKPDAFAEYLCYFIRHNRIDDAQELYDQRHRYMMDPRHRQVPFANINLDCYGFLLKFLKWEEKVSASDAKLMQFDKSVQGWIVNAIDCLKKVTSNHEYFVICVVRMLLFYSYHKKAYLFAYLFQSHNEDNYGAQLLFLNLIKELEDLSFSEEESGESSMLCDLSDTDKIQNRQDDLVSLNNFSSNPDTEIFNPKEYPIELDKRDMIGKMRRLNKSAPELMELCCLQDNLTDVLRDLMDGLETVSEIRNMTRWYNLKNTLKTIISTNNEALMLDARFVWHTRYKRYWTHIDFIALAGDEITKKDRHLIKKVLKMLKTDLDQSID